MPSPLSAILPGAPRDAAEAVKMAIHEAACKGDAARIRALIEKGADVNAIVDYRLMTTPLHIACHLGKTAAAKALIEAGADIDPRSHLGDPRGSTPLHRAALGGHLEILILLIGKGADINAPATGSIALGDAGGKTALHFAAMKGHVAVVAELLARGAFHSPHDALWTTPLHEAVSGGHAETAGLLLKAGASPDTKTTEGETPLHLAARLMKKEKGAELVSLLVAFGADPVAFDRKGKLPESGLAAPEVRAFRKAVADGMARRDHPAKPEKQEARGKPASPTYYPQPYWPD